MGMDGNNQIVLVAFGICKGETGPCWSWWMSVLKECIGDNLNLLFISDRHPVIALAVHNKFPLAFHVLPVLMMAETYRVMLQDWYFKRRELAANMTYKITDWVANKVHKRKLKSATWTVHGVNQYQYQVSDGRYNREVNFHTSTCKCHKWQLSRIPCGHVIAVTRFVGLTDCVQFVADWFKKDKYQSTYAESIHFVGNMQELEFSHHIRKSIPPRMDNPQLSHPKSTNHIPSQGEDPRDIHCSRCKQAGHRRDKCNKPFVPELPVNTRRRHDQAIPRNEQPSFHNPVQQYDNTFQSYN
ncbi:transposase, MuDR, MULE transposase domain protein [Tanacetum coccineum]